MNFKERIGKLVSSFKPKEVYRSQAKQRTTHSMPMPPVIYSPSAALFYGNPYTRRAGEKYIGPIMAAAQR